MATLDDILTTHKNGVVAINNLSRTLNSLYESYLYLSGEKTSAGYSANALVTSGAGRLVRVIVLTAGSSAGALYNYLSYPTLTTAGDGATVTITFSGSESFAASDIVVVAGVQPPGYNGTFTATGGGVGSVQYAGSATGAQTTPGKVFKANVTNSIFAIPNTVGVYEVGASFADGLYLRVGTGQQVCVVYSLD